MSDEALVALARHGRGALRSVDISMCRGVTDAGVGQLADGCPALGRLVVWGCTQLTGAFFLGHKRARVPSPFDVEPDVLAAAARAAAASRLGGGGGGAGGEDDAPAPTDAAAAPARPLPGGLTPVDVEALSMRPLRIYGRPGDVLPAPDYGD